MTNEYTCIATYTVAEILSTVTVSMTGMEMAGHLDRQSRSKESKK
jgi:hypothetical protein